MAVRQLTTAEQQFVDRKRKPDGQRPRIYDASSGVYNEISRDFETWILLTPIAVRSRLGQYLTAVLLPPMTRGTMDDLRSDWLNERRDDNDSAVSKYGALTSKYEDIRAEITATGTGFEDVSEYQSLLGDLTKAVSPFVSAAEDLAFEKSVFTVLAKMAQAAPNSKSPVQTELMSFVEALLQYP